MKQYLRIFSMLLLMLIGIGGGDVFGAEATKTSTLTFTKACRGSGTADDGVTWTVTSDAAESNFDGTKGIHYGTNKKAVSYLQLSTSNITGPIKEIVVNASGASSTSAKLNVTIGGTAIGSEESITSTAKDYTFSASNPLTGTIIVKLSQESATKALYVKSIKVTYVSSSEPSSDLRLSQSSGAVNMGSTLDISSFVTTASGYEGTISYTVTSGADVASVDANGVITGLAVGTATIEVKAAAVSGKFAESKQDFTVTVKDPNPPVFYESFDTNTGTGANDGDWSNSVATNNATYDNTGWTAENQKGASKCLRLGTGSKLGYATTPAINLSEGDYVLTFRAAAWSGDATEIDVKIDNGTLTYNTSTATTQTITLVNEAFSDYEMIVSGATNETKITFTAKDASKNRFFLDEVKIMKAEAKPKLIFSSSEIDVYAGEEETFTAPTLSLKDVEGNVVSDETFTYTSSNETAFFVDNSGKVTFNVKNTAATATITATYAGTTEAYKGLTASYTLNYYKLYSNIKDLRENVTDGEILALTLTNAKVLAVKGSNVYIRDNQGAICFFETGITFANNDGVNGTIKGEFTIHKGLPELKGTTDTNADLLTITAGTPATPKDLTSGDFADYTCDLVSVTRGVVDNDGTKAVVMNEDVSSAQFYTTFASFDNPYNGAVVDVTGIVIPYKANASDPVIYEISPLTKYDIIYHFDEAKDNAVGDAADVKVQLTRTLSKDYWNTFCVPFSMTAKQIAATFGEGTKVTEYASTDGTTLNFTEATAITAGVPYLIKPATTTANPAIEGVTIAAGDAQEKGETYKFIGIYSPKALATDGSELFIGTDSQLYSPAIGKNTINGMRAYLNVPAGTEGARLNILGEMVTAIDGVSLNGNDEVKVFNLKGQRVGNTTKGLAKGIYVVNGKKMVINK